MILEAFVYTWLWYRKVAVNFFAMLDLSNQKSVCKGNWIMKEHYIVYSIACFEGPTTLCNHFVRPWPQFGYTCSRWWRGLKCKGYWIGNIVCQNVAFHLRHFQLEGYNLAPYPLCPLKPGMLCAITYWRYLPKCCLVRRGLLNASKPNKIKITLIRS